MISNIHSNYTASNSPAFGMALRKPAPELVDSFIKALNLDDKDSGKFCKKGLRQLEKELKNITQTDVVYIKEGNKNIFSVVSKDGKVLHSFDKSVKDKDAYKKGPQYKIYKIGADFEKCINDARDAHTKRERITAVFKGLYAMGKVLARVVINPKLTLPPELIAAAEKSKAIEKTHKANRAAQDFVDKILD